MTDDLRHIARQQKLSEQHALGTMASSDLCDQLPDHVQTRRHQEDEDTQVPGRQGARVAKFVSRGLITQETRRTMLEGAEAALFAQQHEDVYRRVARDPTVQDLAVLGASLAAGGVAFRAMSGVMGLASASSRAGGTVAAAVCTNLPKVQRHAANRNMVRDRGTTAVNLQPKGALLYQAGRNSKGTPEFEIMWLEPGSRFFSVMKHLKTEARTMRATEFHVKVGDLLTFELGAKRTKLLDVMSRRYQRVSSSGSNYLHEIPMHAFRVPCSSLRVVRGGTLAVGALVSTLETAFASSASRSTRQTREVGTTGRSRLQQKLRAAHRPQVGGGQSYLESRITSPPHRDMEIHTQVVTQQTGCWEASPDIIWRNADGSFTIRFPDTGEHVRVDASQVPANIQARAG
jgi:hypothetical protein